MQVAAKTSKPSKQRKLLFQAPDHIRYKHFAAPLAPELRKNYGIRSMPVRSGDTVRVTRGDHKGFEGKVSRVDREKYRIYVEGLTREKVDGSTVFVPVHPSKVMITKLNLDDKWRKKILERRKKAKEAEKAAEKVVEEVEKPVETVKVEEEKPAEKEATVKELPPSAVEKEKPKKKKTAKKRTSAKSAAKKGEASSRKRKQKSKEDSESG